MKKIYKYDNCTVIVHIPEDEDFQGRLKEASERFMKKVIASKTRYSKQCREDDA